MSSNSVANFFYSKSVDENKPLLIEKLHWLNYFAYAEAAIHLNLDITGEPIHFNGVQPVLKKIYWEFKGHRYMERWSYTDWDYTNDKPIVHVVVEGTHLDRFLSYIWEKYKDYEVEVLRSILTNAEVMVLGIYSSVNGDPVPDNVLRAMYHDKFIGVPSTVYDPLVFSEEDKRNRLARRVIDKIKDEVSYFSNSKKAGFDKVLGFPLFRVVGGLFYRSHLGFKRAVCRFLDSKSPYFVLGMVWMVCLGIASMTATH